MNSNEEVNGAPNNKSNDGLTANQKVGIGGAIAGFVSTALYFGSVLWYEGSKQKSEIFEINTAVERAKQEKNTLEKTALQAREENEAAHIKLELIDRKLISADSEKQKSKEELKNIRKSHKSLTDKHQEIIHQYGLMKLKSLESSGPVAESSEQSVSSQPPPKRTVRNI